MEDTFTVDEVEDMLDGLLAVVRGETSYPANKPLGRKNSSQSPISALTALRVNEQSHLIDYGM